MCDTIQSSVRQQSTQSDDSRRAAADRETLAHAEVTLGSRPSWWGAAVLAASGMLGCSSAQVAPDYAGEPLAVLQGALSGDAELESVTTGEGMTVGLVWLVSSPDGSKSPLVAETARTEGEFPFGFRLTLFSPPSLAAESASCKDAACEEPSPSPVYQGLVAALDDRADLEHLTPLDILGASLDYGVLYFARDANRDDPMDMVATLAAAYHVPAERGYHLYAIDKDEERYAALRRCDANGLCVESKVAGGPVEQYWPDHQFAECLELVPDAITCTSYPGICRPSPDGFSCPSYFDERGVPATPEELAEDARCSQLSIEHATDRCGALESPWQFPGNPQGFQANISIRLGAGLFEFMN
jgi:hypothetical protein